MQRIAQGVGDDLQPAGDDVAGRLQQFLAGTSDAGGLAERIGARAQG